MPRKATTSKKKTASSSVEQTLVKNLVELQKVHVDLAQKFDKLSKEISGLLMLFEKTAKSFSESQISKSDKEFVEKIDKLLDQNKTIAKGLKLIESKTRERMNAVNSPNSSGERSSSMLGKPLPKF